MAEKATASSDFLATNRDRVAVVTGANKGIGLQVCKQLASEGVKVVLTARDEKRGVEAVEKLINEDSSLSHHLVFHQLDVTDPVTIASLAHFIATHFGKLDILVNNAGIGGVILNHDSLTKAVQCMDDNWPFGEQIWNEIVTSQTYEMAEECLNTNYYGMKRMTEAFIPLLYLSPSPTIVNVSSVLGLLKLLKNEWGKAVLSDGGSLTEEKVEMVLKEFLKDFKEGKLQSKGWPTYVGATAYSVSKAAMNAYTRLLANKYPTFCVNCVAPGFVKTDITGNNGTFTAAQGADPIVRLALQPLPGSSGLFFDRQQVSEF